MRPFNKLPPGDDAIMGDDNPIDEDYDTPSGDEIFQEQPDPVGAPVPVVVDGTVRVDLMPTRIGACQNILLPAGTRAVKIANKDPRRSRLMVWPYVLMDTELIGVFLAPTEAEANDFRGAILTPGANAVPRPLTFAFQDELWARPGVISDTAGIVSGIAATTDDMYISVVSEQWAR